MTLRPDTIVARSTPPGVGAIAVVRLSGPAARDVLARIAPDLSGEPEARRPQLVRIRHPEDGEVADQVLATLFPGPASYTGEDVVELSGHGGWLAPALVLEACLAAGAREAEPGEFTRRAYLNGRLDLVQAEGVLDLIEGRSRALHRAAVNQVERGLSDRVGRLRERLLHLEALLVHHIDFPEEDDAPVPLDRIEGEAEELAGALERMLETAPEGELLREGALTVLAGRPNSGKSSLFNTLLGEERAIVTEIPGTTRDAVESSISLGGFPFRVVDTAGIRESEERVERLGIEVARRYLEGADLVLLCIPADAASDDVERGFLEERETPVVVVRTKADRLSAQAEPRETGLQAVGIAAEVRSSVVTGEGLEELRRVLPRLVYGGLVEATSDVPVITRKRQSRGLRRALEEVGAFRRALGSGVPPEAASAHLKDAESALEEIVGSVGTEAILDHVFHEFCIGK